MAVGYDTGAGVNRQNVSTINWNHTCTGANLVLIVGVVTNQLTNFVTSVTYNNIPLTIVGSPFTDSANTNNTLCQYALINPPNGTFSVVVNVSQSVTISGISQSFTGCNGITNNQVSIAGSGTITLVTTTANGNYTCGISVGIVVPFGGGGDTNRTSANSTSFNVTGGSTASRGPSQSISYNYPASVGAMLGLNVVAGVLPITILPFNRTPFIFGQAIAAGIIAR